MLIRLLPDQIMTYWDELKVGIEETLPPYVTDDPDRMEALQIALLGELAQCWVYTKDSSLIGMLVTRVVYDELTDSTNLLILSIYTFAPTTGDIWIDGYETLSKFALGRGCEKIIAYTNEQKVIDIVEKFGGKAEYTFISIDL